jgi:nucleotide-binding universal stress UspA family protein
MDNFRYMLDRLLARYRALLARLRRIERRELQEFRAWIETTQNLIHLSVLLLIPLVIGVVTALSNALSALPFLLFPPLASGTYTLFANPEGRYADPRRFVGGITAGAVCGWLALELSARFWYQVPPSAFQVHAGAAAFGILLTGGVTWALDVEEPSAFSSALLVLFTDVLETGTTTVRVLGTVVSAPTVYVLGVFLSTSLVAGVFVVWRERLYERRARVLYRSTKGDDRVLVPMRGERPEPTAMLAARLAAAHDAGKVVLFDVVDPDAVAAAETALRAEGLDDADASGLSADGTVDPDRVLRQSGGGPEQSSLSERAEQRVAGEAADRLEMQARRIETRVGVPCQVAVAVDGSAPAATVQRAAEETNCDLVATPYETRHGQLSPFVRALFAGNTDVLVHRSYGGRTRWKRVLVPVRRASDVAHSMLDFATRLAGRTGRVAACHCIARESDRRSAESMLADLVETFEGAMETRVARSSIERFLETTADQYDLVIIGASTDRTAASRFVSPPTFERIREVETDVAILDRNFRV